MPANPTRNGSLMLLISLPKVAGRISPPSKISLMASSSRTNWDGRIRSDWSYVLSNMPNKRNPSQRDCSCTQIMVTNTLRMAMLSSPNTMPLPHPCPDGAIVGIMLPWKTSSPTSKKKLSANSPRPPLKKPGRSLMTIFISTIMNVSN